MTDEAVNLTNESHDSITRMNYLAKERKRRTNREHRCGAGQVPSESQVRFFLITPEC